MLTQAQLDLIAQRVLVTSSDEIEEIYEEYDGDIDRIIKEHFKVKSEFLDNTAKKGNVINKRVDKLVSFYNRNTSDAAYPEVNIWDKYRKFVKHYLKIDTYSNLKDIYNDIMSEITEIVSDEQVVTLPNNIGTISVYKPRKQSSKIRSALPFITSRRISRLDYKSNLNNKKFKLIGRDRFFYVRLRTFLRKNFKK